MELTPKICKICNSNNLVYFAHTARCKNCSVLLNYPYPIVSREEKSAQKTLFTNEEIKKQQEIELDWQKESGERNHDNFTAMAKFALSEKDIYSKFTILDYGGGGGQFSLVAKSLFPEINTFIVDLNDHRLLDSFKPLNNQIKFIDFKENNIKFDFIFMNDVYEHLTYPINVLKLLRTKLKSGGRIFIDTPCTFWLYPITKIFSKRIYTKLLRGTVDFDHQQIWTYKSFKISIEKAGYKIIKYKTLSEFTQPADFYLRNMRINNPIVLMLGHLFYKYSSFIAKNKIMSVIKKL